MEAGSLCCVSGLQAVGDKKAAAGTEPLASSVPQFYMTDVISRASKVMAKCARVRQEQGAARQSAQASVGL
jgi:hypothetical protein